MKVKQNRKFMKEKEKKKKENKQQQKQTTINNKANDKASLIPLKLTKNKVNITKRITKDPH